MPLYFTVELVAQELGLKGDRIDWATVRQSGEAAMDREVDLIVADVKESSAFIVGVLLELQVQTSR